MLTHSKKPTHAENSGLDFSGLITEKFFNAAQLVVVIVVNTESDDQRQPPVTIVKLAHRHHAI